MPIGTIANVLPPREPGRPSMGYITPEGRAPREADVRFFTDNWSGPGEPRRGIQVEYDEATDRSGNAVARNVRPPGSPVVARPPRAGGGGAGGGGGGPTTPGRGTIANILPPREPGRASMGYITPEGRAPREADVRFFTDKWTGQGEPKRGQPVVYDQGTDRMGNPTATNVRPA